MSLQRMADQSSSTATSATVSKPIPWVYPRILSRLMSLLNLFEAPFGR
jgi:hypothetical protein